MKKLFRESFRDLKDNLSSILLLETALAACTVHWILPGITRIHEQLLILSGSPYRINRMAGPFSGPVLPWGSLLLFWILMTLILFVEWGTLIHMMGYPGRRGAALVALSLKRTLGLLGRKTTLAAIPLLGVTALPVLVLLSPVPWLDTFNLVILIRGVRDMNPAAQLGLASVLSAVTGIHLLSVFTLHGVLERKSLVASLSGSFRKAAARMGSLLVLSLLLTGALILIRLFGYSVVRTLWMLPVHNRFLNPAMTVTGLITYWLQHLLIPYYLLVLTRLYGGRIYPEPAAESPKHRGRMAVVISLSLLLVFSLSYVVSRNTLNWDVQVAAHRGFSAAAPENTIRAIQAAADVRSDWVEVDVQLSADGVPVVFHDLTLQRIAGDSREAVSLTVNQLQEVDAGGHFSPEFSGERIPTLEEALLVCGQEMGMLLEIKPYGSESGPLVEAVLRVLENHPETPVRIQSFDPGILSRIRSRRPDLLVGQILYSAGEPLNRLDVDFYTIRMSMLTASFTARARKQGREIWVWTVNRPEDVREVLQYDIDGIISDYPDRVRILRGQSQSQGV